MSETRPLFDLSGEVAAVIGGTGALGAAMCGGLARAGATVAVMGRNADKGGAVVEAIAHAGGRAAFEAVDAASRESVRAAADRIEAGMGPVTILINAAGGNDPKVTVSDQLAFEDVDLDAWRANFDLNVVGGALVPCQEFGRRMVKLKRGSIINIASISAHVPLSRVVSYSAAKAAVLSLTQFLAREWAPFNVRVNSITPGFFPAEQNRRLLFQEDGSPTPRARSILDHTPMGRFGQPSELVGAAVFLACDAASGFVTGTDVRVDGGFLAKTI